MIFRDFFSNNKARRKAQSKEKNKEKGREKSQLNRHVLIGTHHKTGTVWMQKCFTKIAKKLGVPWVNVSRPAGFYRSDEQIKGFIENLAEQQEKIMIFDTHSHFGQIETLDEACFTGFKVIRDPVSVICSATKYHTWSKESWLHRQQARFDGGSYQQKINAFGTVNEQYRFEMDFASKSTIKKMSREALGTVLQRFRYEDLIADHEMIIFADFFRSLGLSEKQIEDCLLIIWNNSIFGGLDTGKIAHIQANPNENYGDDWDEKTREKFNRTLLPYAEKLGYGRRR